MTSLTKPDETSVIKTDEIGRRQTPAARRERLLDEFERSGLYSNMLFDPHGLSLALEAGERVRVLPLEPV
jgi:hypothetical protein